MRIFNMTNPNKDTITVHCIVEHIADPLNSVLSQQQTSSNSQNEETMELDSSLNKTMINTDRATVNSANNITSNLVSNPSYSSTTHLLSDLLQQSYTSKDDKERLNREFNKELNKEINKELNNEINKELNKDQSKDLGKDLNEDLYKELNDELNKDSFKESSNFGKESSYSSFNKDNEFKTDFIKDEPDFKQSDNRDDRPNYLFENCKSSNSPNKSMDIDQFNSNIGCANKESDKLDKSKFSSILETWKSKNQSNYKIEDDFYAELPASTPLQEIVRCALTKQGYSIEECSGAKGFIELRNWKPLTLEQISDDSETTILDILGDIAQVATLRVRLSTARSKSNSDFKDKLLQFLLSHYYGTQSNSTFSANPESLNNFNSKLFDLINENNNSVKTSVDELDSWPINQLLNALKQQPQNVSPNQLNQQMNSGGRRSVNSNSSSSSLVNSTSTNNLELDLKQPKNSNSPTNFSSSFSSNRNSPTNPQQALFSLNGNNSNGTNLLLNNQNSLLNPSNLVNSANNLNNSLSNATNHQQSASNSSSSSFPNRTRIRTSFDPEHELPKLHRWFSESQHPTRQQIQEYVRILNNLESRRGRKPLDVNNVVYWFKNARAAAKRNPGGSKIGNGQSPQQAINGSTLNSNSLNDQLSANELMLAQFNQNQQHQLMNQLQLLNQHRQSNSNIADLLSSGASKNALKNLMLKNAGLIDDELLNCEQEEDEQQMINDFGQQSRDSEDEDNQNEDTDQTFSNFSQTLDLSVKQQSIGGGNNLKRRKIDTSTFDECEEQDEKDSMDGSTSPINQLSSINKRNQEFNRNSTNLNSNKQRFSLNKQLNTLKSFSQQSNQQQQQRHLILDQDTNKDDNQQASLVNSDGELDEENQESEGELDEKDYYASVLNAGRNSIGQLAQNLIGNNNLAANLINSNYLQQTMSDLFMNRLFTGQPGNAAAAAALANSGILNSAAGLIAASSAANLNPNNVVANAAHPLSALNNASASSAFGNNNLLLNNPHSPDDAVRRIRRSRTFIDPITEVPRLEQWFSQSTHPSHSQIVCYTDELNKLPYRQKFPKLEPKNIQFWFKNRRAKFKRVQNPTAIHNVSNQANSGQTNNNSSTTSQSNSQSDSPTPPNDSLLCMNGNREFVGRLVH